jgi:hypothetical protein
MTNSTPEQARALADSLPSNLPFAVANEVEQIVNIRLFRILNLIAGADSPLPPEDALRCFKDLLWQAKHMGRVEHDIPCELSNPQKLNLTEVLIHTPLIHWPYPDIEQCPNPFCLDPHHWREMDEHWQTSHPHLCHHHHWGSPFEVTLTGLLGLSLPEGTPHGWTCPLPGCAGEFENFTQLGQHVNEFHGELALSYISEMGMFWGPIFLHLRSCTRDGQGQLPWPSPDDVFSDTDQPRPFKPNLLSKRAATEIWKAVPTGTEPPRPLDENPLQCLISDLRTYNTHESLSARREQHIQDLTDQGCRVEEIFGRAMQMTIDEINAWVEEQGGKIHRKEDRLQPEFKAIVAYSKWLKRTRRQEAQANRAVENEIAEVSKGISNRQWLMEHTAEQEHPTLDSSQDDPESAHEEPQSPCQSDATDDDDRGDFELSQPHEIPSQPTEGFRQPNPYLHQANHHLATTPEETVFEHLLNQDLKIRIMEMLAILKEPSLPEVKERLQNFFQYLTEHPIPEEAKMEMSLEIPLIIALIQSRLDKICGDTVTCPVDGCTARPKNITFLSKHLHAEHSCPLENCSDMIRFYIGQMFKEPLTTKLIGRNERGEEFTLKKRWEMERCYLGKCTKITEKHGLMERHVMDDHQNKGNVEQLGWFMGIVKPVISAHPLISIRDFLKDGVVYQCKADNCGRFFSQEAGAKTHFGKMHGLLEALGAEPKGKPIRIQTEIGPSETVDTEVPPTQQTEAIPRGEDAQPAPRRPRRFPQPTGLLRPISEHEAQREAEAREELEEEQRNLTRTFILKREELLAEAMKGINMPQLRARDKKKLRAPLRDLLSHEIIPLLEKLMPSADNDEQWLAFEGVYEYCLDKIRKLVCVTVGRTSHKIYGARTINPTLQQAREEIDERLVQRQSSQTLLRRFKTLIEEITAESESSETDTAANRRRDSIWLKKLFPILNAIPEEKRKEVFGDSSHASIWKDLRESGDQRVRVIQWLESLIVTEIEGEMEDMASRLHSELVKEAYNTTKSIAMRRYVDKEHSPPCMIEKEKVYEHFKDIWANPATGFTEATDGSPFFLDPKIPQEASTTMEEFMLNEKNIGAVIRSRSDIGGVGTDGINNRILKTAGKEGIRFMKLITRACIRCGRIMESWKTAKTILIYKKGDRNETANWRPISITNCLYRVFTCLMGRCFQEINATYHIYSDQQKGFIKKTNGCSEHAIILNELYHDAYRNRKGLVVTAIDFTNAFGSVPHELIYSTMEQRGFPEWTRRLVQDIYKGASSFIDLRGDKTESISVRKGVKQGCPLSPLLFNLCLEPLLQLLRTTYTEMGAFVGEGESAIEISHQAYADDIALISERPEGIQEMLNGLAHFTKWSKMEVNVKKCSTSSYLLDSFGHRCSLTQNLKFQHQDIPNLDIDESMKYLGSAVAARRNVKLKSVQAKFNEARALVQKIIRSPLSTVQKIDAVKTFVIPKFDFSMLNGDVSKVQLEKMDKFIRGQFNTLLKLPGLPRAFHHMSWRDGGFGYPSLIDRYRVLTIRSFAQMNLSNDPKIRAMMSKFIESEREFRHISIATDGSPSFLNWNNPEGARTQGTSSIVNKTKNAVYDMGIRLSFEADGNLLIKKDELELKTKSPTHVGKFLTQKLIRPAWANLMINKYPLKGASFICCQKNECSNKFLRNTYSSRSNQFFRFAVAGRTDSLPTRANIQRWYKLPEEKCQRCDGTHEPTLAHIMNGCTSNTQQKIVRHNKVVDVVRRALARHITGDLVGAINEDSRLRLEGLSRQTVGLKPDLWFVRKEKGQEWFELVEIGCPFGRLDDRGDTMERTYKKKWQKYQLLAEEIEKITGFPTHVYPIIVSSMGAVYKKSLTHLKSILKCSDRDLRNIGSWMSEQAILGSIELWIQYQRSIEHTYDCQQLMDDAEFAEQIMVEEKGEEDKEEDEEEETGEEIQREVQIEEESAIHDPEETQEADNQ